MSFISLLLRVCDTFLTNLICLNCQNYKYLFLWSLSLAIVTYKSNPGLFSLYFSWICDLFYVLPALMYVQFKYTLFWVVNTFWYFILPDSWHQCVPTPHATDDRQSCHHHNNTTVSAFMTKTCPPPWHLRAREWGNFVCQPPSHACIPEMQLLTREILEETISVMTG